MRKFAPALLALGLYVLAALVLFAPVLGRFDTHCLSHPRGELPMKLWDQWRTSESLVKDQVFPEETKLVNYPWGGTLFPSDPGNSFAFLPVYVRYGAAARFNVSPFVNLVLAAMGAFLLALHLTRSPGGALLAGTAFGFSPFLLTYGVESGCSEAICVAWFPLLLLFLLRTVREESLVNPLCAGACTFLLTFFSVHYGQFGLLLLCFCGLYLAVWVRRPGDLSLVDEEPSAAQAGSVWNRGLAVRLLFFVAISGMLTLPYAWLLLRTLDSPSPVLSQEKLGHRAEPFDPRRTTGGVLVDLVRPGKEALRERTTETRLVRATYIGPLVLGLAALSLRRRRRFLVFLGAGALFFLLLFLGPHLQVSDALYTREPCNVVFLACARWFPLFSMIYEPFRFHVLVTLFVALLAASGFRDLVGGRQGLLFGVLASLWVLAEYLVLSPVPFPLSVTELTRPPYCERLAADPRPYAVIELPFHASGGNRHFRGSLFYKQVFYFQTLHGRPFPNSVAFFPRLHEKSKVYRQLLQHELTRSEPWDEQHAAAGFAELKAMGFGGVVVHREVYEPEARRDVTGFLERHLGPPTDMGEGVKVYFLP